MNLSLVLIILVHCYESGSQKAESQRQNTDISKFPLSEMLSSTKGSELNHEGTKTQESYTEADLIRDLLALTQSGNNQGSLVSVDNVAVSDNNPTKVVDQSLFVAIPESVKNQNAFLDQSISAAIPESVKNQNAVLDKSISAAIPESEKYQTVVVDQSLSAAIPEGRPENTISASLFVSPETEPAQHKKRSNSASSEVRPENTGSSTLRVSPERKVILRNNWSSIPTSERRLDSRSSRSLNRNSRRVSHRTKYPKLEKRLSSTSLGGGRVDSSMYSVQLSNSPKAERRLDSFYRDRNFERIIPTKSFSKSQRKEISPVPRRGSRRIIMDHRQPMPSALDNPLFTYPQKGYTYPVLNLPHQRSMRNNHFRSPLTTQSMYVRPSSLNFGFNGQRQVPDIYNVQESIIRNLREEVRMLKRACPRYMRYPSFSVR